MRNAREFYEKNDITIPKKLLKREEYMFLKTSEDIEILCNANITLTKCVDEKESQIKTIKDKYNKFRVYGVAASVLLSSLITLFGSFTILSHQLESKNIEIARLQNSDTQKEIASLKSDIHNRNIVIMGGVIIISGLVAALTKKK